MSVSVEQKQSGLGQKSEADKTTLEKMGTQGDLAKERGEQAKMREEDLERLLGEARALSRKGGSKTEITSITEAARRDSRSPSKGAEQLAERAKDGVSKVETFQRSVSFEPGKGAEFEAARGRVAVEAPKGQREVAGLRGQMKDAIQTLSSPLPPPGMGYMDWIASALEREKIVRDLQKTLKALGGTESEYAEAGASASTMTMAKPEQHTSSQRRKVA